MSSSLGPALLSSKRPHEEAHDDNDGSTIKRRLRVTEACNPCRQRKDRCNGGRPVCDNCLRAGRSCTYRPTRKRGLRTGYVRALETMAGMLFSKVQGLDSWITSLFEGQNAVPAFHLSEREDELSTASVEVLTEIWRKSSLASKIEQALSMDTTDDNESNEVIKGFDHRALQLSMLVSEMLRARRSVEGESSNTSSLIGSGPYPVSRTVPAYGNDSLPRFIMPDHGSLDPPKDAEIAVAEPMHGINIDPAFSRVTSAQVVTALPVHWRSYLDRYFAVSHCWLPISQKHDLLRTAYVLSSLSTNHDNSAQVTHGDQAFLKAVLAFTAHHSGPDISERTSGANSTGSSQSPAIHKSITALIPSEPKDFEIGHVRALLILTLVNMQTGSREQAWISIGNATRAIAILIKPFLRREKALKDLDEGTKRTTLCCMALDSLVAAWMGLQPYFNRADIISIGNLATEGLEEWEPWISDTTSKDITLAAMSPGQTLSTFNQFMELISLLNEALGSSNGTLANLHSMFHEPSIAGWVERLAMSPYDEKLAINPQRLNCHLLAASVTHLTKSYSNPGHFGQSVRISQSQLWQTVRVSENFIKRIGASYIPPACKISMFVLRLAVDDNASPQHGFEAELRSFRSCLQELDLSNEDPGVEQTDLQQSRPPTVASIQGMAYLTEAERLLRNLDGPGSATAAHTDSFEAVCRMDSQESSASYPTAITGNAPHNTLGSSTSIDYRVTEDTVDHNAMDATLSDDKLFQSLAELDSDDWTANLPDFMKHLGVMQEPAGGVDKFYCAPGHALDDVDP